ncbi:hypothetical protein [Pedobacter sp. SYSU D00535]|uniref:hypothetical protein n=1 Tax=Pedobacter sp. SYSU D00535 TaxID=2810308 RepID=UPI001A9574BE|nr:hypothetical protein [Pedobacter sp. SYSU D00535]
MIIKSTLTFLIALTLSAAHLPSQGERVVGKIVNEDLEPLEGVTILNGRTRISAQTNSSGVYSIKAVPGDPLLFSLYGRIGTRKVVRNLKQVINIILLDEPKEEFDMAELEKKHQKLSKLAQQKGIWNY